MNADYLLIGNSAGAIGAAEAIRETDRAGSVVIVSDEPYPCYSRPLISKYLSGERYLDGILFRPRDFYERNGITTVLGKKVTSLRLESHRATLDDGSTIGWKKLLLATGGEPIVPRTEGLDKKGVFTFTALDDAKRIQESLDGVRSAVVIGGGLIGVSVAEALVKLGLEVTIVEMKDRILNTILDEPASRMAEDSFTCAGARIICGQTVTAVLGESSVEGVALSGRQSLACQMLIVAIGVTPRMELARNTAININRGILVDGAMATSHPEMYACGDVVETYDFAFGASRPVPIWPNAFVGGRVAGFNMAGMHTAYPDCTAMNSLNYFGLDITSAGLAMPGEGNGYEVLCRHDRSSYRKLILRDDVPVGMILVNDIEKSGIYFNLMRSAARVSGYKDRLLADDFGLACLPKDLWEARVAAATP